MGGIIGHADVRHPGLSRVRKAGDERRGLVHSQGRRARAPRPSTWGTMPSFESLEALTAAVRQREPVRGAHRRANGARSRRRSAGQAGRRGAAGCSVTTRTSPSPSRRKPFADVDMARPCGMPFRARCSWWRGRFVPTCLPAGTLEEMKQRPNTQAATSSRTPAMRRCSWTTRRLGVIRKFLLGLAMGAGGAYDAVHHRRPATTASPAPATWPRRKLRVVHGGNAATKVGRAAAVTEEFHPGFPQLHGVRTR